MNLNSFKRSTTERTISIPKIFLAENGDMPPYTQTLEINDLFTNHISLTENVLVMHFSLYYFECLNYTNIRDLTDLREYQC